MRSALLALVSWAAAAAAELQNVAVAQTLDLSRAYAHGISKIEFSNIDAEPASHYTLLFARREFDALARLEVTDKTGEELQVDAGDAVVAHGAEYREMHVALAEPLHKGEIATLKVAYAFAEGASPYPPSGKQGDSQLVLYETARGLVSPYATSNAKLFVRVPAATATDLVSGEELQPNGRRLLEFTTLNLTPLEVRPLRLHFEYPQPIPQVLNLARVLTVSHFASKLQFDESYDLVNAGTALDGEFNRVEFVRNPGAGLNGVTVQRALIPLPANHSDEYYVDLVGNVSTSHVADGVIDVRPRYPLAGGWHYNFTVGFSAPLPDFLREANGNLILKVPIVGGPDGVAVKRLENRVVLPRGAHSVEAYDDLGSPVSIENAEQGWLDWRSSPSVTIEYTNIVSEHRQSHLFVTYKYSLLTALRAPVTAAALLFGGVLVWRNVVTRVL